MLIMFSKLLEKLKYPYSKRADKNIISFYIKMVIFGIILGDI